MADNAPELSLVIPVFNEGANVDALVARLRPVLDGITSEWEVVFVDDGSRDDTLARIRAFNEADPRLRAVSFSRNFGKEIAIAAGLDHVRGRATVIMDADLQHPPEMIATFVEKWREGYAMVYGQRTDRRADSPMRRKLTQMFYRLFDAFGETPLPEGAGDFRLLDRRAVDALRQLGERARFSKGLYAWIGFPSIGVPFDVADRVGGMSKFSTRKLFRFAADGITSFSTLPLKLWTYVGALVSAFAFVTGIWFIIRTMLWGVDVPGYASLIVSVMFLAGVQLISLGVIGEYIGRIFAEVKRRPLYIVGEQVGFGEQPAVAMPVRPLGVDRRRA
ncbi:bactoprenol glucosyl transferase [Alsobacter metallidurans]|uniref:Bactoprenol glucosyl transferase n=1 Tax=Alsobacter metallidurans TaxID=340221 RepID=A0A917I5P9_9HYPH|nr:glycosyltransferase family 2 protein [Alsobacter metallidurans]GGH13688.1 bactoprenol glucosyl transferase [Alsobacter metallidurans]